MKTIQEQIKDILNENNLTSIFEINDSSVSADFNNSRDIIKYILKDKKIKDHVGKDNLYFDDADLVFIDKTVPLGKELVADFGWDIDVTMKDLKKSILSMPGPKPKPKVDQTKIGKFNVKLPKEMAGVLGNKPTKLENPRAIVDADDNDSKIIKKNIHNAKEGIKVRIMKRKTGNKVYIDGKDPESFFKSLEKLKKIK